MLPRTQDGLVVQGGFPLANIVVELISEQGDGTFELRPGAPKVLSAALDALFFSGTDPMAGLEPALRLLLVLIEDKKSPGAARELLSVILARPEVPPLLEKYTDLDRATRAFRERFEGSASSVKALDDPPAGAKRPKDFKARLKG